MGWFSKSKESEDYIVDNDNYVARIMSASSSEEAIEKTLKDNPSAEINTVNKVSEHTWDKSKPIKFIK